MTSFHTSKMHGKGNCRKFVMVEDKFSTSVSLYSWITHCLKEIVARIHQGATNE